jgi:LytS/YehU family sensor histidine kinase
MNTLNNIHALVDIDPEQAKNTIVEPSKMMRYVLYEGNNTMIPLQRECDFIKHYVRLMSMRYSDKVKINIDVPLQAGEGQLPPLLLITFVENAFKHGITYKKQSFIDILLYVDGGKIYFSCTNSKAEKKNGEQGGVGLANVRQRLDIIYGDRYDYDVKDTDDTYQVSLTLPMDNS